MVEFKIGKSTGKIRGFHLKRYGQNDARAVFAEIEWEDGDVENTVPVSVNLNDASNGFASTKLPPDEFYAKSYSEGEIIHNALVNAGWVEPSGLVARTGFVQVPRCRLSSEAIILSNADELYKSLDKLRTINSAK